MTRKFTPGRSPLYGTSAEKISEWTGVHITTARRWLRGEEPPRTALVLIQLMNGDVDLGVLWPDWAGWRIRGERLVGPNDVGYTAGEILATDYWRSLIRHYQAEQRLPRQADWVEGAWTPAPELDQAEAG